MPGPLMLLPAGLICAGVTLVALAAALILGRRAGLSSVRARLLHLAAWTAAGAIAAWIVSRAIGNAPGEGYNDARFVLRSPYGWSVRGVACLLALAVCALEWRGTRRILQPGRRELLRGLRCAAAVCALGLFLEPALELRDVARDPNRVFVMLDDSGSMALADEPSGPTRAERQAKLIAASQGALDAWRAHHKIEFFSFSETLKSVAGADARQPLPPRGDATAWAPALEELRQRHPGNDLAAFVLLSDGAANAASDPALETAQTRASLQRLGVPVHTAWVGREGLADRAIPRLAVEDFAFVRTVAKVGVGVRATGLPKRSIPVVLTEDGRQVASANVTVGGDTPEAHVELSFTPSRVGKFVYRVAIPVDAAESVPENNHRSFILRVIRDRVRALQVAGRPSWDERWLRSLFKADPNVDLISFFILRTPDDLQPVPASELSLIPFPTDELFGQELGSFDIVVLQNFEFGPYGIGPYLEEIRKFVAEGGGLVMVGGDLAFSSGDYFGTPVADVLPVTLAPRIPGSQAHTDELAFSPVLTPEGNRHPITRLAFEPPANLQKWKRLPELTGANLVEGLATGAISLLDHPRLKMRSGQPQPVLVAGESGKGRVVALLTDSSWRWGFSAAGTAGEDGKAYETVWGNMLRWLVRDPELELLSLESDRGHYAVNEAPQLVARLRDTRYQPAPGSPIELTLARRPSPEAPATGTPPAPQTLPTDEQGEARFALGSLPPGTYDATARSTLDGRPLVAKDVFLVETYQRELERPEALAEPLESLARITGGVALGGVTALPADLPIPPPRVIRVDRRTDVELWSGAWLFFLAISCLGLHWVFRRRSGYL